MAELPPRGRPEGCLTDLTLDRLRTAELGDDALHRAHEHLEGCPRCRARRDELAAGAAEFLASAPRFSPRSDVRTRSSVVALPRKRRTGPLLASGLALAAAVLLMVMMRDPDLDGTRLKGRPHIGFFVKRGDAVTRGADGARVRPGDHLRFTYSSDRPTHFAILSLDGAHVASVYFPAGPTTHAMPAGSNRPLPDAIELDGTLGEEHLWALFCAEELALEPLRSALARQGASAFTGPASCAVERLRLVKEAAP